MASLDETEPWFASEEFLDLLNLDLVLARKLLDDVFEPEEAGDLQPKTILPDLISRVESWSWRVGVRSLARIRATSSARFGYARGSIRRTPRRPPDQCATQFRALTSKFGPANVPSLSRSRPSPAGQTDR